MFLLAKRPPAAMSEEKGLFSQAIQTRSQLKYKQTENKAVEENFRNTLITLLSNEKVLLFQEIFPVLIVSQEFCILLFDCCFFWFLCWRVGQNAV